MLPDDEDKLEDEDELDDDLEADELADDDDLEVAEDLIEDDDLDDDDFDEEEDDDDGDVPARDLRNEDRGSHETRHPVLQWTPTRVDRRNDIVDSPDIFTFEDGWLKE